MKPGLDVGGSVQTPIWPSSVLLVERSSRFDNFVHEPELVVDARHGWLN